MISRTHTSSPVTAATLLVQFCIMIMMMIMMMITANVIIINNKMR